MADNAPAAADAPTTEAASTEPAPRRSRSPDKHPQRDRSRSRDRDRRSGGGRSGGSDRDRGGRDRDRDRGRDRDRDRRDRDRDRGRDRGRDRDRRDQGRDRRPRDDRRHYTDDEDSEEELNSYFSSAAGGARHFGLKSTKAQQPARIWDGFQWVTQTDGATAGAITATGLSRKARRLHFGNLPGGAATIAGADQQLAREIWEGMKQRGLEVSEKDKNPVLSVWMSGEQNFAFVEFLSAEDAASGLMLDGMEFMGQPIRVSRPSDYIPDQSAAAVQQMAVQQMMADPVALAAAMAAQVGAAEGAAAPQSMLPAGAVVPTQVLIFTNLTAADTSNSDLDDVLEDVQEEANNSGKTISATIARVDTVSNYQTARPDTKVGDVFVKFEEATAAHQCYLALHGRMFAGNQVQGSFMEPSVFDTITL